MPPACMYTALLMDPVYQWVCVSDTTDNVYVSEDVRQLSCIARILSMWSAL